MEKILKTDHMLDMKDVLEYNVINRRVDNLRVDKKNARKEHVCRKRI